MPQVVSSAANPPGTDMDSESSDVPSWPANRGPEGETIAAVDISAIRPGIRTDVQAASRNVNQSDRRSTRSPGAARNSARIGSSDSGIVRRWSTGSMPVM
jgi:hypothetical protein